MATLGEHRESEQKKKTKTLGKRNEKAWKIPFGLWRMENSKKYDLGKWKIKEIFAKW